MTIIKYVLCVVLLVLPFHFIWSAAVVGALNEYYDHRVLNVRNVENLGREWEDLTTSFSAEKFNAARIKQKPLIMFVGSSVTYGFPWQESVVFSKLVANALPRYEVANLSIVGAGMRGLTDFATCYLNGKNRPAAIYFELPLVNSVDSIKPDTNPVVPRACRDERDVVSSYWSLVVSRPFGTGWISLLWPEQDYEKPEVEFFVRPVSKDYFASSERFATLEENYISELKSFLDNISSMADRVYAYISPIYLPAIAEAGGDQVSVTHQIQLTMRICREFGRVTCLDASQFESRRELFYNLTHLNQRGHRAFADWFVQHIESEPPEGRAVHSISLQ